MAALSHVPVGALNLERFGSVLAPEDYERFLRVVERGREAFDGRVVWNVNSTGQGGGVAEMLVSLLAYARGAGIDARWVVIAGNEDFFVLTKRIHNFLHGSPGDGGELDHHARRVFDEVTERNAAEFRELIKPEDVVVVHDPQPAGLIPAIGDIGCPTVWRCHVGLDQPHPLARRAWEFLIPYVRDPTPTSSRARRSRGRGLEKEVTIIPPSIDAFSPRTRSSTASGCSRSSPPRGSTKTTMAAQPPRRRLRTWTGARAGSTAPLSAGSGARCARLTVSWSRSRAGTR
jgi:trehalose synthase